MRTALRRPPHTAASILLGARRPGRRLVPVVAVGFALQTLIGALTYLLPVVFGLGASGNRKLSGILDLAWPRCSPATCGQEAT